MQNRNKFFLLKNLTIKQANLLTITIIFLFTLVFVGLLVQEMYKDYEQILHTTFTGQNTSDKHLSTENQKQLKYILIKTVLAIITLAFIIFAIALGLYSVLNAFLHRDMEKFIVFFEKAAHEERLIDAKEIYFRDFEPMILYANEMVQTISKQKKSLQELNVNLEEKVEEKTKHLEEILSAQKEFLRYTVHETNTPLSVILTSIEIYNMKNQKDRQLSKIEAAVKNIFNIYDDLSYLIRKDQFEYPKGVIDLNKYIQSRVDFFREVAEHALLEINYVPSSKESKIYFNETKLQRVIDNNLTNAIKYTLPKQTITVGLSKVDSFLEFSVGSKSKTIENPHKIFDEFYREEAQVSDKDGFGIGLELVKTICEEENIRVTVTSNENYTEFRYLFKMMGE